MNNIHAAQLEAKAPVEYAAVKRALENVRTNKSSIDQIRLMVAWRALWKEAPMESAAAREAGRMYQLVALPMMEEGTALLNLVGETDPAATEASELDLL